MDGLAKSIQDLSTQFVPLIMALVFHEYAHGFVAKRWGDKTAEEQGRLTLNPLPHLDPMGSVVMPILFMMSGLNILFGWAKPVPIDPKRFTKYRPALFMVSAAGPAMNCILAFVSGLSFMGILLWVSPEFYLYEPLVRMALTSVSLNFMLALFNLIPLPPLDGSKMIESFLSLQATQKFESVSRYSFFILIGLIATGSLSVLYYPISFLTELTLKAAASIFGASEVLNRVL